MKIIKPLNIGLLYKTYESDSQYYLVVTVIGFFSFSDTQMLESEIELWKFVAEELGNDSSIDLGMPKPNGEYIVTGNFYSNNNEPVSAGTVKVTLGNQEKSINVFGDRFWKKSSQDRWVLSPPESISTIGINYENAFGGKWFERNPLGKGYIQSLSETDLRLIPVPNINDPKRPINAPDMFSEPVGYAPYDLTWPQRFSKLGTYDVKWLNDRFPGFADDFDPSFFNIAPYDQHIQGFFAGDEEFTIRNMHQTKPFIQSSLPGVRPRCFINHSENDLEEFKEINMHLDTTWLFPHAEKGILIHHGQVKVSDDQARKVKQLVAAYEKIIDPIREQAHYQKALLNRLDKEKGHIHALNEKDLMAEDERSAIQEMMQEAEQEAGESVLSKNLKRKSELATEESWEKVRSFGLNPEDHPAYQAEKSVEITVDNLDELDSLREDMQKEAEEKQHVVEKRLRLSMESMGYDYDEMMLESRKKQTERSKFPAEEIIAGMREAGIDDRAKEEKVREAEKKFEQVSLKYGHFFDPLFEPSPEKQKEMRTVIEAGIKNKTSFRGMEFPYVDLSGLDLREADFSEAFLEGANLRDANLSGSNLEQCMLARADLSGASVLGTQMTEVNLGKANLTDANFTGSQMDSAILYEATIDGAKFVGCRMIEVDCSQVQCKNADFSNADLRNSRCIESRFENVNFTGSILSQCLFFKAAAPKSNFSKTSLKETVFVEFDGRNAQFEEADLTNLRTAMRTNLQHAIFKNASLVDAYLRDTDLTGANFENANITSADLSESKLVGSRFYRAIARQAMFMNSDLSNSNMVSINLFEGSLQGAILTNTDLRGANLFAANLLNTDFSTVQLEYANTGKTVLSKWSPQ